MCQLNAYLLRGDQEEPVMEDVTLVRVEGDSVLLTTLFQESKTIDGRIRLVDFMNNKLLLEANSGEK